MAAQRELKEETGYWARSGIRWGICIPSIGYADEVIHIFHANGWSPAMPLDQDEFLELFAATPGDEIAAMIANNRITDGKTITAFCRWQPLRRPGIV